MAAAVIAPSILARTVAVNCDRLAVGPASFRQCLGFSTHGYRHLPIGQGRAGSLPFVSANQSLFALNLSLSIRRRPVMSTAAQPAQQRQTGFPVGPSELNTVAPVISRPQPQLPSPVAALRAAESTGTSKAACPPAKVLMLAIMAGAYISMGALLALSVGGALPQIAATNPGLQRIIFGLFGLPFGLTLVLSAGGELFTGNTAVVTAAYLARRVTLGALLRNWAISYIGNFVGALFVVWLVSISGILVGPSAATAIAIAKVKTSLSFASAFARGLFCNWLVCLAVWLASSAFDVASKFATVVVPVSAFVAMGFDHSIANMFLIPMAMSLGSSTCVTVKSFLLGNLLPVTLGNILGGAVFVAGAYHLIYNEA